MTAQPKPAWITVLGVFVILFGATSLFRGATTMATPALVDFQKEFFAGVGKVIEKDIARKTQEGDATAERQAQDFEQAKEMFSSLEKFLDVPQWYLDWSLLIGLVTTLVAGFYLLSGIFLVMVRPGADRWLLAALLLSLLWGAILAVIHGSADSLYVQSLLPNTVIGMVIDSILLAVLLTVDRSPFRPSSGPGATVSM